LRGKPTLKRGGKKKKNDICRTKSKGPEKESQKQKFEERELKGLSKRKIIRARVVKKKT